MFIKHTPNILSIIRLFLCPFLFIHIDHLFYLNCIVIIAGCTDFFDGYISRKFAYTSKIGAILDPLADKAFIISSVIIWLTFFQLPHYILYFFIIRESLLIISFIASVICKISFTPQPSMIGKLTTCCFFLSFLLRINECCFYHEALYITVLLSAVSFMQYIKQATKHIKSLYCQEYQNDVS